jgi:hypothetical protein
MKLLPFLLFLIPIMRFNVVRMEETRNMQRIWVGGNVNEEGISKIVPGP